MSTVFIGGSRRLGRLNDIIRERLNNIVESDLRVVIGDANGGDRAVQAFLAEKDHRNVVVYCMGNACRNNLGGWPVRMVKAAGERGFSYYSLKDAEMARDADCGFMIWDAKSKGTLVNIWRLIESQKPAVVYFAPDRVCRNLKTKADLMALLGKCMPSDRQHLLELLGETSEQMRLFPSDDARLVDKRSQRTMRTRQR